MLVFLLLAAACGYAARLAVAARAARPAGSGAGGGRAGREPPSQEASWDDIVPVDVLGLEVGYRLIPLVRPERGRRAAEADQGDPQEIRAGHRIPSAPVHIRDNLELKPSQYRMLLRGS